MSYPKYQPGAFGEKMAEDPPAAKEPLSGPDQDSEVVLPADSERCTTGALADRAVSGPESRSAAKVRLRRLWHRITHPGGARAVVNANIARVERERRRRGA